jgi:hypothetical protein
MAHTLGARVVNPTPDRPTLSRVSALHARARAMATITVVVGGATVALEAPSGWQRGSANGAARQRAMRAHVMSDVVPLLGLWTNGLLVECVCGCVCGVDRAQRVMHDARTIAVAAFECDRVLGAGMPYARGGIVPVCPEHNGSANARAAVIGRIRTNAERVALAFAL